MTVKLGRLNHIGVATPSIAESIAHFAQTMGATRIHTPFDLEEQGVKVCFVDTPMESGYKGMLMERTEMMKTPREAH